MTITFLAHVSDFFLTGGDSQCLFLFVTDFVEANSEILIEAIGTRRNFVLLILGLSVTLFATLVFAVFTPILAIVFTFLLEASASSACVVIDIGEEEFLNFLLRDRVVIIVIGIGRA